MNIPTKKILKILGYIFVPLLPMAIGAYFLFPYINEEKHQEVAEKYDSEFGIEDSAWSSSGGINEDFTTLKERASVFQEHIRELRSQLDSLSEENDSLKQMLSDNQEELDSLRSYSSAESTNALVANTTEVDEEEISEKFKSLLDLEEDDLTPILDNMSDRQLVRIFEAGSGRQRTKLLRSLKSKRVAKLMREVL